MLGLEIVDVAIGLTLVYLLLASVASALRERIEAVFKTRAVDLEQGISELLQDPKRSLTERLYNHPIINGLFVGKYDAQKVGADDHRYDSRSNLPSYIPAKNFALALLDVVARGPADTTAGATAVPTPALTLASLRQSCARVENESVRQALLVSIDSAQGDLGKAQANIETWFNNGMDRVSGWYRRRSQWIILLVSVVLTLAINVNTLTLIERLSIDTSLRQALVERADQASADGKDGTLSSADAWQKLGDMRLPIGWAGGWPGALANPLKPRPTEGLAGFWAYLLQPLIGWLLTALAVSMGAPFWFDTLNKLSSFRSTLKPKEGSAPAAAASPPTTVVQMQAAAPAAAPAAAAFQPHEWASGNPQEGVL
ncbi:MAG: hypothetical protein JWR16_3365 [Nevskia sp.]|nr:hypothetical protein [Nevskia sp.]